MPLILREVRGTGTWGRKYYELGFIVSLRKWCDIQADISVSKSVMCEVTDGVS